MQLEPKQNESKSAVAAGAGEKPAMQPQGGDKFRKIGDGVARLAGGLVWLAEGFFWGLVWLAKGFLWGLICLVTFPFRYLFALEVDKRVKDYADKDGYGPFTALATFALAQGAALTTVAKGEDRTWLVLTIYSSAVAVTMWWIRAMLRATKKQPVAPGAAITPDVRAYDTPTITYGRWAQFWTLLLAVVLIYLGTQGLLPNQTTRIPYDGGDRLLFAKDVKDVQQLYYGGGESWYTRFLRRDLAGKQLFWFESDEPFRANYSRFRVKFVLSARYEGDEFQLFLARRDSNYAGFRLEEIAYVGREAQRTFDVVGANKDDFVVVIGYARYKPDASTLSGGAAAALEVPGSGKR